LLNKVQYFFSDHYVSIDVVYGRALPGTWYSTARPYDTGDGCMSLIVLTAS